MQTLSNLWIFFDGKKTVIGTALLSLSAVITQLVIGVNHYDPAWLDQVVANINYVGEAFMVGGIIHKSVKTVTK